MMMKNLDIDIEKIQTRHLRKFFALKSAIKKRTAKKQPCDQKVSKLNKLVDQSSQQTQQVLELFKPIQLQSELPISAKAEEIKKLLSAHQVLIVAGETGCGKTTQLPKICMQAGYGGRGLIAHTQPRRVAATSVAKRIADEVNCKIGELIGYSIRFNKQLSEKTRLKIMTDGVLLTEIETDPLLSQYEVIIIDEAHERSLNIDFLLGFLKNILAKRKELKLIITSATIDPERFSKSFNNAPIVNVEGRTFPVEVRYRPMIDDESNDDNNILNSISAAVDECISISTGDILIFADGEGQIKSIVSHLKDQRLANTKVMALYARLSISEQQKIFERTQQRKIIVSTNVAETSLTVPGIVFVVDIGTARVSRFSQRNKIQQLPIEKISQASADQRKGRCGRVSSGVCIRLYSEQDYLQREAFTCAEIKRTNLSAVVLRLKAMKVNAIEAFPFIEKPSERAWKVALNSLFELGALDKQNQITSLGERMAKLPVDPQLARILAQPDLIAVEEMLIICALMSVREVRMRPHDKQQKSDQLHAVYHKSDSDILTAIELWRLVSEQKKQLSSNAFKQWCSTHMINFLGWLEWRKVYQQLKESVQALGIKVNQHSAHDDQIHSALIPGFITHIFCKTQEVSYQGVRDLKVWLHPSSLSFKKKQPWLLSAEMIETEKVYARMNCPLQPSWIEKYSQHLLKNHYYDIAWRKKNGQVMAYLNQSLLGLPIVQKKLVNYASVEPEICRQLFLKEGLAKDQLTESFPFLDANRHKLKMLEEKEQRQRVNNIRIDVDALATLYGQYIPDHICSAISLKKWFKKDPKQANKLLTFSLAQLTEKQLHTEDEYPTQIKIKGFALNLSYCFAPGQPEDGVSVEIPDKMLGQFNDRDFDWLVPGYLAEKILAAIKSLPKPIRRELIPLNETASQCCERLSGQSHQGKLFVDELASTLHRLTGIKIAPTDFDMANIPSHLLMKYQISRGQSKHQMLSLSESRAKFSQQKTQSAKQQAGQKISEWQFGQFEVIKTITENKVTSRIFQGLHDLEDSVEIKSFASVESALASHKQGVARLIMLAHGSQLNQMFNSWPDKKLLEMLSIRMGGLRQVFDSLVLKWATSLVEKKLAAIEQSISSADAKNGNLKQRGHNDARVVSAIGFNQTEFNDINQAFAKGYRKMIAELLGKILPLIKQREAIFSQLSDLNPAAFDVSIKDMRQQLHLLWSRSAIIASSENFLADYERYQQGLSARIKRVQLNYPKEQAALETWLAWAGWWSELSENPSSFDSVAELKQLFWNMQEFRLSLFSPGIKVVGAVSAKKLQKQFEQIEANRVL